VNYGSWKIQAAAGVEMASAFDNAAVRPADEVPISEKALSDGWWRRSRSYLDLERLRPSSNEGELRLPLSRRPGAGIHP
jgi:hypothetical protein